MTWETHRGDEWWYSGAIGKTEASCDGKVISIDSIPKSAQGYKKNILHSFLLETYVRFKDLKIMVRCNRELEGVLRSLENDDLLNFEMLPSKYGNSAILKSVQGAISEANVNKNIRKPWWRWW